MATASIDLLPAFLCERFDELDPAALRAAAEYAAGDSAVVPDELPSDVSESFALQDEETLTVISVYASGMARGKRLGAEEPDDAAGPADDGSGSTDDDSDPEDWWDEHFV